MMKGLSSRQRVKKALKYAGMVAVTPLLLFIILAVLLYLPPVQNWMVGKVADYASEKLGMEIKVGKVRLAFPLDLSVYDFLAMKKDSTSLQAADTIVSIGHLLADVRLLPLIKHQQIVIDAFEINQCVFNTDDMIPEAKVEGRISKLYVHGQGINLPHHIVDLERSSLDKAFVTVRLNDSVPPDTSTTKTFWKIKVGRLDVSQSHVRLFTPGDSLKVEVNPEKLQITKVFIDTKETFYGVEKIDWTDRLLAYDNRYAKPVEGLDPNHILLSEFALSADSISYAKSSLQLSVNRCSFKEKNGFQVKNMSGRMTLDSMLVYVPEFALSTDFSQLKVKMLMPMNVTAKTHPGVMTLDLNGYIGRNDLISFAGNMPKGIVNQLPRSPLLLQGKIQGNLQTMTIDRLNFLWANTARLSISGRLSNLTDMNRLATDLKFNLRSQNMAFANTLIPKNLQRTIHVPDMLQLQGYLNSNKDIYRLSVDGQIEKGYLSAKAFFNPARKRYDIDLKANLLPLHMMIPSYGLSPFTGSLKMQGSGYDPYSPATNIQTTVDVRHFNYQGYSLKDMKGDLKVKDGRIVADLHGHNAILDGSVSVNALFNKKYVKGTLIADVSNIDLHAFHFVKDQEARAAGCAHLDIESNLNNSHRLQGFISDLAIHHNGHYYRPEDMVLDVMTRPDTTLAIIDCGDFHLDMKGKGGYERLIKHAEILSKEVKRQWKNRIIDKNRLTAALPRLGMELQAGRNNIFSRYLYTRGIRFDQLNVALHSSVEEGLNGHVAVNALYADSMQLDTLRLSMKTEENLFSYSGMVKNAKNNPQQVFTALVDGTLSEKGTTIYARLLDSKDRIGVALGAKAKMEDRGIRISLDDKESILGYKAFQANDSNYIFMAFDKRLSADLTLKAKDGTGIQVTTDEDNTDALQDLTVSLIRFDLGELTKLLPFLPKIKGVMDGDYHIIQTTDRVSVSSAMNIRNMVYEEYPMGNIGAEFVYMPEDGGGHYIDGILSKDGKEIGMLTGRYHSVGKGTLDATMQMVHLPLDLINGMIPDQIVGLKGYGDGVIELKGSLSNLDVNGTVTPDSASLISVPYGIDLRFAKEPIHIRNSRVKLETIRMYATNKSPLVVNGFLDFSSLDRIKLDINMMARNFQLISAKENTRSEVFGDAFVNFFGSIKGGLEHLKMRGKLEVLGSTDMTYVLRDSPLTTDKRLEELVSFVNFSDTVEKPASRPKLQGFDMDMALSIDEGAHIMCNLNAEKTNYINLDGGGELRIRSNDAEGMRLTGRYTLANGEMKYSLPVIPLKTFTIRDGSYIEFTGDPMNPKLNITATERTKAAVSESEGISRMIDFECGVMISKTLNDMGLEFIIDAPEDLAISNELMSMSKEERGKLAVTMLTTGMYLADGNTSKFSMNSALGSFLQSEINQIAGSALRSLDLSFGVDNTTDAMGAMHTDYSFKFSKRFWNNRLRVVIGGKFSSNNDYYDQNDTFFDNVTFEYRVSPTSNKYLKLFYDRNSYDWIEGNVGRYGVGFIWRRKLQHFKDIFNRKSGKSVTPVPQGAAVGTDSLSSHQPPM